jgi:hypothetical protein
MVFVESDHRFPIELRVSENLLCSRHKQSQTKTKAPRIITDDNAALQIFHYLENFNQ